LLPGGDVDAALRTFETFEARLPLVAKMEARYLLWKATAAGTHLEAACGLLADLRGFAPEQDREDLIQRVPLYREIEVARRSSLG
jgi:hypothetical protein